ncbi:molecular chaperone TorD family protein [Nocardioides sp. GY 10113]|uniref:TorD/DmsD family molecular chaperone n=1 Tax=Nocardioides sp. GY 10113 TaxID=2569761 RepID=UPI001458FA65|nr:molecular chaperone TorD family protein [Nocardioides sp. GY 10113]
MDRAYWENHAAAFAVLGRLHREPPSDEALASITGLLDEWPLPGTPGAAAGLDRLRRSRDAGEDAAAVRADHDRLYGVSAVALVAPYESVHRGQDRLVFDTATLQVRESYRAIGLQAPRLNLEPDDHIGLEFDFVAQAVLRAIGSPDDAVAEAALEPARAFLVEHLLPWAPAMLVRAATTARTDFMAGIALLSSGALDSARAAFGLPAEDATGSAADR